MMQSLETKRLVTRDCLARALDGLERDNVRDVDWLYVYDQLTRADEQVINAHLIMKAYCDDDDEDLPDTAIVPVAGHAAADPADSPDVVIEGGDA